MTDEKDTAYTSIDTVEFEIEGEFVDSDDNDLDDFKLGRVTSVDELDDDDAYGVAIDTSGNGGTVQLSTSSIDTISSYTNNGRLTFIDDNNEAYEPDGFKVTDEDTGAMRVSIPDQFFPPDLAGMSPKSMHRWEVVITTDGETRTGFVIEAQHDYNKNKFTLSVDP